MLRLRFGKRSSEQEKTADRRGKGQMQEIILCAVGTVWAVVGIVLLLSNYSRYEAYIERLDSKEYFLKELFPIGYAIEEKWLDLNGTRFQKRIGKLGEMYGKKNARFLVMSDAAAQISYVVLLTPFGILLGVIAGDLLLAAAVIGLVLFLVIYVEYDKNAKVEKRHEEILRDFPHVLSQMALLINAGMPLREAIEVSSKKEGGTLYAEMRVLTDDMKNGIPEYEALRSFAERCGVDEVRKLSSLIVQNVRKGSSELAAALMSLSGEVWRERVSQVKEQGEKASAKLLLPILIIFGGILLMVAVPMFRNMNI